MRCGVVVAIALVAACSPRGARVEVATPLPAEERPIRDVAQPRGDDTFVVDGSPGPHFSAERLDDGTPVFITGDGTVISAREPSGSRLVWCPHSLVFASTDRTRVYNILGQALREGENLDHYAVARSRLETTEMTASSLIRVLRVEGPATQTTILDVGGADSDCARTEPVVAHG